jgi:hypothetical protein
MKAKPNSFWLNDSIWSWIPVITTPAIFIASGLSFIAFLLSDERYKYRETMLIQVYLLLFVLTLIIVSYLFLIRLDHLAGLVTAVFSSNFAYILNGYMTNERGINTLYRHPFESIGNALVIWSLVACLLNAGPGLIRASTETSFRSNLEKNRKRKTIMMLGASIGAIPVFTVFLLFIEQITIPTNVIDFFFQFWLFYLPIVFAILLGLAWLVDGPYPKDALEFSTWIKALVVIYLLNFLSLWISYQALYIHNPG